MDIKRILKYQEHGDDGLFIEGMHQQEIKKSMNITGFFVDIIMWISNNIQ